jgi:dihydrofolate synthase/folylpolyglutamate synthase
VGLALTSYAQAVEALYARTTGGVRFGLERTRQLLQALDDPHLKVPVLHVAGTNGKGSSVATMEALLRARGDRVGRYTSPHLVDFRERMLVDGRMIPERAVTEFVDAHGALIERLGATFFEVTTALAFDQFVRAGVDVAVIETGLGGRLDSTNVVDPLAAGVVSVGLDHTEMLGATIEAIAGEKGGIFKAGRPAVIGVVPPGAREVLRQRAAALGASEVREVEALCAVTDVEVGPTGTRFTLAMGDVRATLETPLVGRHQAWNTAFALAMLDAAGSRWRVPLAEARFALSRIELPGRFQRVGRYLFDVAHNPDGARVLAETVRLAGVDRPMALVLCVLNDKDWRGMLDVLAPLAGHVVLTMAPTAPPGRAWSLADAEAYARELGARVTAEPSIAAALALGSSDARTVLVTGSFHTVGDAMASLQVTPLPG